MKHVQKISLFILGMIVVLFLVRSAWIPADQGLVNNRLLLQETTTPAKKDGHIYLYAKADKCLYMLDEENVEYLIGGDAPSFKSYTFRSQDPGSGVNYIGGFYQSPVTDANLTNASPTVTYGEANHPYAAHAFAISGGDGSTDGSDLVLTVSGTSITDAGIRTESDSQVIEATAGASPLNEYNETPKKWLGTITYTLTSTGGSAFDYSFNYGFCKYEDWGNRDFTITDFECTGNPNMNDSGFDIELLHHKAIGWTYHATAFVPGTTPLYRMTDIHSTESDLDGDEPFAFKLAGVSVPVDGRDSEGTIIRVTTGVNNAVFYMNIHLGVNL